MGTAQNVEIDHKDELMKIRQRVKNMVSFEMPKFRLIKYDDLVDKFEYEKLLREYNEELLSKCNDLQKYKLKRAWSAYTKDENKRVKREKERTALLAKREKMIPEEPKPKVLSQTDAWYAQFKKPEPEPEPEPESDNHE